jgi:hypothetical protein
MTRSLLMLLLVSGLATASGCVMCAAPDDTAYSAYGGAWQRDDMYHGRVGSILDPTGGPYLVASEGEPPTEYQDWDLDPQTAPGEDESALPPPPGAQEPPEELLPPQDSGQRPRPLPTGNPPTDTGAGLGTYR